MVDINSLSNEEKILLEIERQGSITSADVQLVLNNCGIHYASNILREMWRKKTITRKRERKKPTGFRYRYRLSVDGEKLVLWLHNKGF